MEEAHGIRRETDSSEDCSESAFDFEFDQKFNTDEAEEDSEHYFSPELKREIEEVMRRTARR